LSGDGLRLAERVIVITGASRGLGAAVAEACAREGARLVLIARTRGALEEVDDAVRAAGGEAATLIVLDLAAGSALDPLGAALLDRFGRVDGLVACAAELGELTPVAHLEPAVLEKILAVNLVSAQRLIRTLDPLIRAAPAGRAVFLTCDVALAAPAYWGGYAASKAGLEVLVRTWAAELRITNARANLVDPGPMATRLRARAFPGERTDAQPSPAALGARIVELLTAECQRNGERVRL
jgi:NAD(P)-dependent dehydrogenase (short-subunit alcohol dehydrogenase family)